MHGEGCTAQSLHIIFDALYYLLDGIRVYLMLYAFMLDGADIEI